MVDGLFTGDDEVVFCRRSPGKYFRKGHTASNHLFASLRLLQSVVVPVLKSLASSDSKLEGNSPGNDGLKTVRCAS